MHATPAPGGHFRRLVAPSALLVGAAVLIYVLALGGWLLWSAAGLLWGISLWLRKLFGDAG